MRGEDEQREGERGNKRERGSQTESDGELRQKGQQFSLPRKDKKHLSLSAEKFKKHTHKINISSLYRYHVQTHTQADSSTYNKTSKVCMRFYPLL